MLEVITYRWIRRYLMRIDEPLTVLDASRIAVLVFELYVRITSWQRLQDVSSFNPSSYIVNGVKCNDVGWLLCLVLLSGTVQSTWNTVNSIRKKKYRWLQISLVLVSQCGFSTSSEVSLEYLCSQANLVINVNTLIAF